MLEDVKGSGDRSIDEEVWRHTLDECKQGWLRGPIQLYSSLLARTFDLSSAYRQVALNEQGRRVSYIGVFNPNTGKWCLFQSSFRRHKERACVPSISSCYLVAGDGWLLLILIFLLR